MSLSSTLVLIVLLMHATNVMGRDLAFDYDKYFSQHVGHKINLPASENEQEIRDIVLKAIQKGGWTDLELYLLHRLFIYFARDRDTALFHLSQIKVRPDDFLTLYNQVKHRNISITDEDFNDIAEIFEQAIQHPEIASTVSTIAYDYAYTLVNNSRHVAAIYVLEKGLALFQANDRSRDKLFLMDVMAVIQVDLLNPPAMVKKGLELHDQVEKEYLQIGNEQAAMTVAFSKGISILLHLNDPERADLEFQKIAKDHFAFEKMLLFRGFTALALNKPYVAKEFYRLSKPERSVDDSKITPYYVCLKALLGYELNFRVSWAPCMTQGALDRIHDMIIIIRTIMKRPLPEDVQSQLDSHFREAFFKNLQPTFQNAVGTSVNRIELMQVKQENELARMKSREQERDSQLKTAILFLFAFLLIIIIGVNGLLRARNKKIHELHVYIKTRILQRFLPPVLIEEIVQGRSRIEEEPRQTMVTILFCDLVDFTRTTEVLGSQSTAKLLHEYFEQMSERIFKSYGTIDKFIGDAIMVIFGAPVDQPLEVQVQHAIECAEGILDGLQELNQKWQEEHGVQFAARIGINSGEAIVGSIGSERRSDYTVIGSTVNVASRIEQRAKPNTIMMSQSTAQYVAAERLESCGWTRLRGLDQDQELFRLKRAVEGPQKQVV